MAITVSTGTGQALACDLLVPVAPSPDVYSYIKDEPGDATMIHTAGALDQPNTIRYAVTEVADVFKNSPVSAISGQSTKGLNILVQVNEAWKVYDDANPDVVPYYLPVSAHFVVKVPLDSQVSAALVGNLLNRMGGAFMRETQGTLADAVAPLLHGVCRLGEPVPPV